MEYMFFNSIVFSHYLYCMLLDYTKIAHLHLIDKRNMNNFIHSAEKFCINSKEQFV